MKKENLDIEYKNFRPVSNLNFISKITEKAVLLTQYHPPIMSKT